MPLSEGIIARIRARIASGKDVTEFSRYYDWPDDVTRTYHDNAALLTRDLVPVTTEMIAEAESVLGCTLPPPLKQLYRAIGNGGFGPGYGLYQLLYPAIRSLTHTYWENSEMTFLHELVLFRVWPDEPYIAFCCHHYGVLSIINGALPDGPIALIDMNEYEYNFIRMADSLEEWCALWLDGVHYDVTKEAAVWDFIWQEVHLQETSVIPPLTLDGRVCSELTLISKVYDHDRRMSEMVILSLQSQGGDIYKVFFWDVLANEALAKLHNQPPAFLSLEGHVTSYHFVDKDGNQQVVPAIFVYRLLNVIYLK